MFRQKKSALQKATDLLARQEQSTKTLRLKLLARGYDGAETDDAIAKLVRYGYIDDAETCRRQFENFYADATLSVRQIVVKLMQRGFEKNFIDGLIPNDADEHDKLVAEKLLAKKFPADKFDRAKAWQFLSTRGFDGEIISAVVAKFTGG